MIVWYSYHGLPFESLIKQTHEDLHDCYSDEFIEKN